MDNLRWWHIAIGSVAVVLTGMIFGSGIPLPDRVGAQAALTAFVVCWFTFGRLSWRNVRVGVLFTIAIIVTAGTATAFFEPMAILQAVAYPLVWTIAVSTRRALVANVSLATAVGIGMFLSSGSLAQAAITAAFSLAGSLAIGLWITQIETVSSQRQALVDELRAAQNQIALLNREAGVTGERERLAREIHDTIAQDLTGLVMLAERTRRELGNSNTDAAAQHLESLENGARSALAETRSLVAATAALGLEAGGIAQALERLGERFQRETGIAVSVEAKPASGIDRDSEVVLLRCAQEGLANVRKHAGATEASVVLGTRGGMARLTISDDGAGFDPNVPSGGFGLSGMRERLALVSGNLRVTSKPGHGTVLEAELPIGVSS